MGTSKGTVEGQWLLMSIGFGFMGHRIIDPNLKQHLDTAHYNRCALFVIVFISKKGRIINHFCSCYNITLAAKMVTIISNNDHFTATF